MAITDQRHVTFDKIALKQIVEFSPNEALQIGFPSNQPTGVVLQPLAQTAAFEFGNIVVTLEGGKLAALIISYCIRSGIKIPRDGHRTMQIDAGIVTLGFRQEYPSAPVPTSGVGGRRQVIRRAEDRGIPLVGSAP